MGAENMSNTSKSKGGQGRGPQNQSGPRPTKTTGTLKKVSYTPFSDVGRTLHIDNSIEAYDAKKLLVYGLHGGDRTFLLKDKNVRVVWFKTDQDPSEHDWYGNVCFVINFSKLLERFGGAQNLYYVEEIEFANRSYSRVLLTKKDEKHLPNTAIKMDLKKHGSPIIESFGSFSYASGCKRTDGYKTDKHGIEFMIDATVPDLIWLYKFCTKKAVNHSDCNRSGGYTDQYYMPGKCRKFNTLNLDCPSCMTEKETERYLREEYPGLLGPGMVDEMPDITKLSIKD